MMDSMSGEKQPRRDSTEEGSSEEGKKRIGRPKGSGEEPKYANITMHDGAIRKLKEHERPNEHLNNLLRNACDQILTRIQARGHAFLCIMSMTAAGCSVLLVSLYMAVHT